MKRNAAGFLTALIIASLIAGLQFLFWNWNNPAHRYTDADSRVGGYAYSGYQRDQSPLRGNAPSEAELASDLDLLAQTTRRIRTYSSYENAAVPALAREREMRVSAGAWLNAIDEANARELDAVVEAARRYNNIERVIVGNEVLLRGDLEADELIAYLDEARRRIAQPVSTAEPWHVWLKYPELARHVDYIAVHLLPYHEGVPVEAAVDYAFQRLNELHKRFPGKRIVIGEIGWPSRGPVIGAAVPSVENQARFMREYLARVKSMKQDYFLMEAVDQPWKVEVEGWAGAYWGVYNAERELKFPFSGEVVGDDDWQLKAAAASALAFLPMLLLGFVLRDWSVAGRICLATMVQLVASGIVLVGSLPNDYYLSARDNVVMVGLFLGVLISAAVLLSHGFEFAEVMFKRRWQRAFVPQRPLPRDQEAFVSIHLACCNEPPEMVIATIDSLARLNYSNYEVLVVDNNTADAALWQPVEAHCAKLGPRFRFFHLPKWPGFKAGALNFALQHTDARAQIVGVVDADYVVDPDWIATLAPHFLDAKVAVVQAPQAHRDYEHSFFKRMCNWEFDGFFRIGMHHRNERNALIQHGTMTLVRRSALSEVGGWSEWCICEDSELGLRLIELGYDTRYVDRVFGRGLTPSDFSALKSQRFRWAFGAMQILKGHLPQLLGKSTLNAAQRYHFLTGWLSWFGDALQMVFAFASLAWTVAMLTAPKLFSLPVAVTVLPMLAFLALKAAMGPIAYRRAVRCSWADVFGASLASLGLSHAIARGVFAGVFKRKGEFVRTPKGWKQKGGWLASIAPVREELGLLAALLLAAAGMVLQRGTADPDANLWIAVLLLTTLPYWAALGCQLFALLPEKRPLPQLDPLRAPPAPRRAGRLAASSAAAGLARPHGERHAPAFSGDYVRTRSEQAPRQYY